MIQKQIFVLVITGRVMSGNESNGKVLWKGQSRQPVDQHVDSLRNPDRADSFIFQTKNSTFVLWFWSSDWLSLIPVQFFPDVSFLRLISPEITHHKRPLCCDSDLRTDLQSFPFHSFLQFLFSIWTHLRSLIPKDFMVLWAVSTIFRLILILLSILFWWLSSIWVNPGSLIAKDPIVLHPTHVSSVPTTSTRCVS